MEEPLKILMVEDCWDDVDLIERELKKACITFVYEVVKTAFEFKERVKDFKPNIILTDHSLPRFNSIEVLKIVRQYEQENGFSIPVILVSGSIPNGFAEQSLLAGADDYILKDNLKSLAASISKCIEKRKIE